MDQEHWMTIDIEASGLGSACYPIEIALADHKGQIAYQALIRPTTSWMNGNGWDQKAEAIHGISQEHLLQHGLPPSRVVTDISVALGDHILLSDHGFEWDRAWVDVLWKASMHGGAPPTIISATDWLQGQFGITKDAYQAALGCQELSFHRAGSDAARLARAIGSLIG